MVIAQQLLQMRVLHAVAAAMAATAGRIRPHTRIRLTRRLREAEAGVAEAGPAA